MNQFVGQLYNFFSHFSCQVAGFLEKNRDGLRPDLEDLIARSGNQVSSSVHFHVSFSFQSDFDTAPTRKGNANFCIKQADKGQIITINR